jgi:predicted transcriptional regulator
MSETDRLDARLSNVEGTVEQMDQRLGRIEGQLDRLDKKIDTQIEQVQRRMIRVLLLVAGAITAVLAIVQVVVAIAL